MDIQLLMTFILLWSTVQTFALAALNVSGLIYRYDNIARERNWKEFCDFCFSFHISWISTCFFLYFVPEEHFIFDNACFSFLPVTACLNLLTFVFYRLIEKLSGV